MLKCNGCLAAAFSPCHGYVITVYDIQHGSPCLPFEDTRYVCRDSLFVKGNLRHVYGEDSAVKDYSYFYQKLIDWLIEKLNFQKNEGPAEEINTYLNEANLPRKILVSVGATRYTEYGEHNFLQDGDKSVVVIYPGDLYTFEEIFHRVSRDNLEEDDISVLIQEVVL